MPTAEYEIFVDLDLLDTITSKIFFLSNGAGELHAISLSREKEPKDRQSQLP